MEILINTHSNYTNNNESSNRSTNSEESGRSGGGSPVQQSSTQKLSLEEVVNGSLRLLHIRNDVLPHGGDLALLSNVFNRINVTYSPTFKWERGGGGEQQQPICAHMMASSSVSDEQQEPKHSYLVSPTYDSVDDYPRMPIPVFPRAVDEEVVNTLESINHRLLNETLCSMLVDDNMLLVAVQQLFLLPKPAPGDFDVSGDSNSSVHKCRVPFGDLPDCVRRSAVVVHKKNDSLATDQQTATATDNTNGAESEQNAKWSAERAYSTLSFNSSATTADADSPTLSPAEHVRDHLRFIISTLHLSSVAFSKDLITAVSIKLFSPGLLDAISFICENYVCPLVGERVTTKQKAPVPAEQVEAAWEIVVELRLLLQHTITKMNEKAEESTLGEIIRGPVAANPEQFHGLLQFLVGDMCGWYDAGVKKLSLVKMNPQQQPHQQQQPSNVNNRSANNKLSISQNSIKTSRSASISRFSSVGIVGEPTPTTTPRKSITGISSASQRASHRASSASRGGGGSRAASHFKGMGSNEKLLYHFMGLHDDEGVSCDRFGDSSLNDQRNLFHRYITIHCLSPLVTRQDPNHHTDSSTGDSSFSWLPPTMNTSALSASLSGAMFRIFEYMMLTCSIDNKELLLSRVLLHPRSIVLPWVRGAADASLLIEAYKQRHNPNGAGGVLAPTTNPQQQQQQQLPNGVVVDSDVMIQVTQFIRSVLNFAAPWYSPTGKTSQLSALFLTGGGADADSPLSPPNDDDDVGCLNEAVVGIADTSNTSDPANSPILLPSTSNLTSKKKKPVHKPLSPPLRAALRWKDFILSRLVHGSTPSVYWRHYVNLCATSPTSYPLTIHQLQPPHTLPLHTSLSPTACCVLAPFIALYHLKGGPGGSKVTLFHSTLRSVFTLLESDLPPSTLIKAGAELQHQGGPIVPSSRTQSPLYSTQLHQQQEDHLVRRPVSGGRSIRVGGGDIGLDGGEVNVPDTVSTGCGSYQVLPTGPSRLYESMRRAKELEDQRQQLKETKPPPRSSLSNGTNFSNVTSDAEGSMGDMRPTGPFGTLSAPPQHPYEQMLLQLEPNNNNPTDLIKLALLPSFPQNGSPSSTVLRGTRDEESGVLDALLLGVVGEQRKSSLTMAATAAGQSENIFESCDEGREKEESESDPTVLLHTLMHRILTRIDVLSSFRAALLRLYPANPLLPDPLLRKPGMFPLHKRSHRSVTTATPPSAPLTPPSGGLQQHTTAVTDAHSLASLAYNSIHSPHILLSLPWGVGSTWSAAESLRERAALLRHFSSIEEGFGLVNDDDGDDDEGAISERLVLAGELSKYRLDSIATMSSRAKDQQQLVLEGGGVASRKGSMSYVAGFGGGLNSSTHRTGSVCLESSSSRTMVSPSRVSPSRTTGGGNTPPRTVDELPTDLPSPVSKHRGGTGTVSPNGRSMLRTSGGSSLPMMIPHVNGTALSPGSSSLVDDVSGGISPVGSDVAGNPTAKEMENVAAFPKRLRCLLGRLSPAPGIGGSGGGISPSGSGGGAGDGGFPSSSLSPPRSTSPCPSPSSSGTARPPQPHRGASSEAAHPPLPSAGLNRRASSGKVTAGDTAAEDEGGGSLLAGYGSPSRELNPPTALNSAAASPERPIGGRPADGTRSPLPQLSTSTATINNATEEQHLPPISPGVAEARPPSSEPNTTFSRRRVSIERGNDSIAAAGSSTPGGGAPPLVPTKPKAKPQSAASVSSSTARVQRDDGPRAESAPSPSQVPAGSSAQVSPRTGRTAATTGNSSPTAAMMPPLGAARPISPNRGPGGGGGVSQQPLAPRATSPASAPSRTAGGRASRTNSGSTSRQS